MSRVSTVKPHLTLDEVKDKIATAPTARCQQKWMIIYNALVDPRPAIEIAKHTATSLRNYPSGDCCLQSSRSSSNCS